MPVEIRELNIKTDVVSRNQESAAALSSAELNALKRQIIAECKRSLKPKGAASSFNR